ncbi:MAG: tetratricopeptide repeat protein [Nannocystaceae bacterium]|nr:tetratricopeptide repeat protein [Nannocystaceae bacterium]
MNDVATEDRQGGTDEERRAAELRCGEYRIVELLGQGAMGVVYRAHDPRLDRSVAIKLVHPRRIAADPVKARARLLAEARALARVHHPNVLAVFDVGERDDAVYVALDLVDGVDLAQWLQASARGWAEIVAVFAEIACGLAAVHAAGVVHRDVKPANVLIERGARGRSFGRVLVADFGIARASTVADEPMAHAAELSREDDTSLTETGRVVGTPVYMAPEQHGGGDVGPAADQYALCVALFEALYGRRPFRGPTQSLLRQKLSPPQQPPPSSVPAWLWQIVRRGLSPRPDERFASMTALEQALRRGRPRRRWLALGIAATAVATLAWTVHAIAGPPACTQVPAELDQAWDDARRQSVAAAFGASRVPAAGARWQRVRDRFDAYAQTLAAMYGEACEAQRDGPQAEAMFDRQVACLRQRSQGLAHAAELLARGEADVLARADELAASLEPLDTCGDRAALATGVDAPPLALRERVAEAASLRAHARALQAVGRFDDAARAAHASVEAARATGYVPVLVQALVALGELRERQGHLDEARAALDEALALGEPLGYDEPVAAAAVAQTWIAAEYDRDLETAEHWAALARSRLARLGDPAEPTMALHNALGTAYVHAQRLHEARREFEQALERTGSGEQAVWAATLHSNLGNVELRLGALGPARERFTIATELFRVQLGEDDPAVASAEARLAKVLDLDGRHHEAVARLRRVVATLERLQAPPSELGTALVDLGLALRGAGLDDESEATHRRAIELLAPTGDRHSLAYALVAYGRSCVDRGVFDAAQVQFEHAVSLLEHSDPGAADLGRAWIGLGDIRVEQGRPELALSLYQQALDAAVPGSRQAAAAWVAMARVHDAAGRFDQADAALDRSDEILVRAPLVLAEDRLTAAIVRVQVAVHAGRAATAPIDALARRLDDARPGGSRQLGEGDLALGQGYLARGERAAARAALERALAELDPSRAVAAIATAREALSAAGPGPTP